MHIPSKLETSVALCCETKLHILEWPFIIPSTRFTFVMIMLFNQLLDMPHLRWVDYLGKGEMLTNRDVNTFLHNILEKYAFCGIIDFSSLYIYLKKCF